jgi:hypothetical protein
VSAGSNPAGGTRTRADSLTQPGGTVHPAGCHPLPGCDSRRHVLTPSAPHTLPKMLSRCRQAPRAGACKSRWASPRPRRPAYCLQHCRTWPFLGSSGAAGRHSALSWVALPAPAPHLSAPQTSRAHSSRRPLPVRSRNLAARLSSSRPPLPREWHLRGRRVGPGERCHGMGARLGRGHWRRPAGGCLADHAPAAATPGDERAWGRVRRHRQVASRSVPACSARTLASPRSSVSGRPSGRCDADSGHARSGHPGTRGRIPDTPAVPAAGLG